VVDCLLAYPAVALDGHGCGVLLSWGLVRSDAELVPRLVAGVSG
jgi:hypothetical protein